MMDRNTRVTGTFNTALPYSCFGKGRYQRSLPDFGGMFSARQYASGCRERGKLCGQRAHGGGIDEGILQETSCSGGFCQGTAGN